MPGLKDYSTGLHFLGTNYGDNVGTVNVQLEISKVLMKDGEFTCLDDILVKIKQFSHKRIGDPPEWWKAHTIPSLRS